MDIPLEKANEYIHSLDLSLIIKKMILSGWKRDQAEEAAAQYKRLLYLWKKYGNHTMLPPSIDIDEVWHTHILDTQKYQKDCDAIFGRYLHHYPYFGIDENSNQNDLNDAFERTKKLYREEFGKDLTRVRLDMKSVIASWIRSRRHKKILGR